MEMYGKSPERCGEFWRAVQEMWLKLYSSNMVTVAAINVGFLFQNSWANYGPGARCGLFNPAGFF